jgi:hypothetical protein
MNLDNNSLDIIFKIILGLNLILNGIILPTARRILRRIKLAEIKHDATVDALNDTLPKNGINENFKTIYIKRKEELMAECNFKEGKFTA